MNFISKNLIAFVLVGLLLPNNMLNSKVYYIEIEPPDEFTLAMYLMDQEIEKQLEEIESMSIELEAEEKASENRYNYPL